MDSPINDNVPQSTENVKKKFSISDKNETELTAAERKYKLEQVFLKLEQAYNPKLEGDERRIKAAQRETAEADAKVGERIGDIRERRAKRRAIEEAKEKEKSKRLSDRKK